MIATTTAKGSKQLAELHAALETVILQFGYKKLVRSIDVAWRQKRMNWQAYEQLRSCASNVNANLKRKSLAS